MCSYGLAVMKSSLMISHKIPLSYSLYTPILTLVILMCPGPDKKGDISNQFKTNNITDYRHLLLHYHDKIAIVP